MNQRDVLAHAGVGVSRGGAQLHLQLSDDIRAYCARVLVQREMETRGSPLVSIPPCGRGFSGIWVYRSDVVR